MNPRRFDWHNLRLRALSAAVLAPAVVALVWYGEAIFLAMVAAASALLAIEWGRMSAPAAANRLAALISAIVVACVALAWVDHMPLAWSLLILGAGLAAVLAKLFGLGERPADAALGVLYIGIPTVAFVWLRSGEPGRDWGLMLLAIAWSADIFAFIAGNIFKGPKLWPKFSPNKTWSGFAGGLLASAAASVIVVAVAKGEHDPTKGWAAVIGLSVGLFTMAGDLWESMLKRRYGVKDSGALIPGHGGLLDRVDGLMFAIVAMATARAVARLVGFL